MYLATYWAIRADPELTGSRAAAIAATPLATPAPSACRSAVLTFDRYLTTHSGSFRPAPRLVQDQQVGAGQHGAGNHATHFFTTRQDVALFKHLFTGEQHFAQKSPDVYFIFVFFGGKLTQPVNEVVIGLEERFVV
jgi:hypothetical protein